MKIWTVLLAGCFVSCSAVAAEPSPFYAGVNYVHATYDADGFDTLNPTAVALRFGTEINPNFAVEGRAGFGVSADTIDIFGIDVDLEIDNFYGVYARGMWPTGYVTPYALLGWTKGKVTASAFGASDSESDDDISYGLGIDMWATPKVAINLEYARLFEGDGYKVDGLSLGVAFKF